MIALGKESCCETRACASSDRARLLSQVVIASDSDAKNSTDTLRGNGCRGSTKAQEDDSKDFCCQSIGGASCEGTSTIVKSTSCGQARITDCCAVSSDTYLKSPVAAVPSASCGTAKVSACQANDTCCRRDDQINLSTPRPCCEKDDPAKGDDCRSRQLNSPANPKPNNECNVDIQVPGIENQGTDIEQVVLAISGMTCTGCETKLNRTLNTQVAVSDLKTSLILSRAEFIVNLKLSTVEQVLAHLERTTEFKCERIKVQGSSMASLELCIDSNGPTSQWVAGDDWPVGVVDVSHTKMKTIVVTFNPRTIGARKLVESSWCSGTSLAPVRGDLSLAAGSKHVRLLGYQLGLSVSLTVPILVLAWAPLTARPMVYNTISLGLATIVQGVIVGPFYLQAFKAVVFSRVIEMDLLIVLSTTAAYVFSVVAYAYFTLGRPLSAGQLFETSTLLVTLIMLGRWVAALARHKAVESISLQSMQATTAIVFNKDDHSERMIDARLLQHGDLFKVHPDTRIPTDGVVQDGLSEVDESMLTGETRLVQKQAGSVVIAGSINGPGVLTIQLSRLPGDNTIHDIAAMVDEAKLSKPKLQDLADRVASYFVPVVLALTVVVFSVWLAIGKMVRGETSSKAATDAILYAVTVLIVSCPCAIGLAVPMVIVVAGGVAAQKGIIFKSYTAIEVAHKVSHLVFDKTGTLTKGEMEVVVEHCTNRTRLPSLLGLIQDSSHPVSTAVAKLLQDAGIRPATISTPKSVIGKGMEGWLKGRHLQSGNSRWLNASNHELVRAVLSHGNLTVFCFAIDGNIEAVYGLQDQLRPAALETVQKLQALNITVHLVSGDDDGAVQAVATNLGIPQENVSSRCSPSGKRDYIQRLLSQNEIPSSPSVRDDELPVVIFCGDGTNDAVALTRATVGVHINQEHGTDVARSAADVVILQPSLDRILVMIELSRKAVRRIWFNFAWSFVYNLFAVLLAAGAFVRARIPPEFAGLGELVSVLPVIVAALLLKWERT